MRNGKARGNDKEGLVLAQREGDKYGGVVLPHLIQVRSVD